ncbi:MAG: type II CAAX endopeptidase family protein [candidate division WOR-3 bacterium]|nr:type II CAAX endopeptidase family protein [candidate division WOR-3 bacterium]
MSNIITDIKDFARTKIIYYILFSTLIVNFMLYHRNFFRPCNFWLFFSFTSMLIVPLYLHTALEDTNRKIQYAAMTLFSVFLAVIILSMFIPGFREFLIKPLVSWLMLAAALIPSIVIALITKGKHLSHTGLNFKNMKLSVILTGAALIIMIPIVVIASRTGDFSKVYPLFNIMKRGGWTFVLYEIYFLLFFIAWEYLFRGFMLFSFVRHIRSPLIAILLQAVIFTFAHLGKPEIETVSSLFGGLLLGIIIYRLKNIWPAVIVHFAIALTMDIMSVFF